MGETDLRIARDDLTSREVQALLKLHLEGMRGASPPGSVFALDLGGLIAPDVAVYVAWIGSSAVGMGALKRLGPDSAEIKSMRTHPAWLRRGVATQLLARLIQEAAASGVNRLSLETGSGEAFDAALALYRRFGFEVGGSFGDYEKSAFNQFLHLRLA